MHADPGAQPAGLAQLVPTSRAPGELGLSLFGHHLRADARELESAAKRAPIPSYSTRVANFAAIARKSAREFVRVRLAAG